MTDRWFRWMGPVLALALLVSYGVGSSRAAAPQAKPRLPFAGKSLVIASWGGVWTQYSKQYFGDPFAKATGAKVTYVVSGNGYGPQVINQERAGNVQWDLLDAGGNDTFVLHRKGYLENFPPSLIAELKKLTRPGSVLPYNLDYGDTADMIACNPKIVQKCPSNPKQFWDVKDYPGPRAIVDTAFEAMAMAEEAAGVPHSKIFPMNIQLAINELKKIKPFVKVWPSSGAQQQQVMIDGEVGMSIMWNGRYYTTHRDAMPQLRGLWGGCLVGPGGWNVVKGAPDKDVAFAFIKWFAEHPVNQANWTDKITYPTPTKQLLRLVPKAIAKALPAAHHCTELNGDWMAGNSDAVEKAWQQFITG